LSMNPAFRKYFMCTDAVLGKKISYLIDPEPFEELVVSEKDLIEKTIRHDKYNLVAHQIMYCLEKEKQFVGIFVNITKTLQDEEKLQKIKEESIKKAKELLEHQINVAQEMAKFLGESTARGEELVENLMSLVSEQPEKEKNKRGWKVPLDKLL